MNILDRTKLYLAVSGIYGKKAVVPFIFYQEDYS